MKSLIFKLLIVVLIIISLHYYELATSYSLSILGTMNVSTINSTVNPASPQPIHVFKDLDLPSKVKSYREEEFGIRNKSGIYSFINLENGKQYIGSAINLYERMQDHLAGRQSNVLLQRAFKKYGKNKFHFLVYAYAPYSLPAITDLETLFMSYFSFDKLYNLTYAGGSMLGYKHTKEAIEKMKARLIDPKFHPMFGKFHAPETRALISKPGELNPMFGRIQTPKTRLLISNMRSTPVAIYDSNNIYLLTFKNNVELSKYIGCNKSTVGRYLKSGKLYNNLYYIRSK